MSKLLFNVAKELNVGTTTIVEYLAKKGFSLENKPIAKVSDDMYRELSKQFQSSVAEKEKADQIVIGNRPMQKKEDAPPVIVKRDKPVLQISLNKNAAPEPAKPIEKAAPVEVEKPAPTIVVAAPPTPVVAPPVAPATAKEPEVIERPKVELRGPKILGKINLDAPKVAETPKPQQPTTPANNPVNRENRGEGGNRDNNRRTDQQRNNNNDRPRQDNKQGGGNSNDKPKQPRPERMVSAPRIQPVVEEQKEIIEPELIRAATPTLKGLKILGKINIEEKPSATKKTPQRGGAQSQDDRRKRKRKKVSQPVTEDSIKNIGQGSGTNPQGGGQGQGNNNRGGTNQQGGGYRGNNPQGGQGQGGGYRGNNPQGGTNQQGGGQGQGGNRGTTSQQGGQGQGGGYRGNNPQGGTNQQGGGYRGNNPQGGQGGGYRGGQGQGGGYRGGNNNNNRGGTAPSGTQAPKEISQKDIDDQIKATMARLNIGGKNKRQKIRRDKRETMRGKEELRREGEEGGNTLQLTEFVTASEIASLMDVPVTEVITTCFNVGAIVSINQRLDAEIIELIASEFGYEVEFISAEDQLETDDEEVDAPEDLLPRAPIVTVMGHVDHGKTSLLDYIRSANVVSGEAGGITQHIGAYEVKLENGKRITFLDTPGHEAFTAMRARGAKVTDIAIIIIAADDSLMPQTREAISHAQAAGVPMIFAINKIDKPGADPEKIKNELAQMNLLVEEWGGKYQSQEISAKKGLNIDLLLEKILLEAEMLDLKANPDKKALGTVIEASLDKGRGYVTKLLVQEGTLNEGDAIVSGAHSGKIKAMFNERGVRIKKAGPSAPVLVLGLGGAPQAGEKFKETESETEARQIASKRAQISREQANRAAKRISLDEIGRRLALGSFKELNLIIKGDVDGSVEALADSLIKQSIDSVKVNVIHKAVGAIIDADIMLASASDAIVIGFQVRPTPSSRKLAETEGVEIKSYSIIYEAIDEIRSAIEGMLEPKKEEKIEATVEVREVYKISKLGTIAGCYVQEGKLMRNNFIRVIRDGIVVFPVKEGAQGKLGSLKRYKDDVKEIRHMMECGLTIDGYNDIQVGDTIESYDIIEIKQKLK
jgi:translation initiation factor IF-2